MMHPGVAKDAADLERELPTAQHVATLAARMADWATGRGTFPKRAQLAPWPA
jgi:hypothetical protein